MSVLILALAQGTATTEYSLTEQQALLWSLHKGAFELKLAVYLYLNFLSVTDWTSSLVPKICKS